MLALLEVVLVPVGRTEAVPDETGAVKPKAAGMRARRASVNFISDM